MSDDHFARLLLGGAWGPVTRAVGLLRAAPAKAVTDFMEWKRPLVAEYGATIRSRRVTGSSLEDLFTALLPLQSPQPDRYLLLPTTNPEWTAIYDNYWKGTEPHSLTAALHDLVGYETIEVISIPHTITADRMRGRYGCVAFIYHHTTGERWVRVMNDGRWRFTTVGDPLPFEDLSAYQRPRQRDRFTHTMLNDYLASLDLHPFSTDFYVTEAGATIVEELDQEFPRKHWTLSEARAGIEDTDTPVLVK